DLSLGETAALSLSKGMRRGQNSPGGKSQKRPARSLGTQEKASPLSIASSFNKYQLFWTPDRWNPSVSSTRGGGLSDN
ncbi:MAG: hypothetical protein P8175_13850, partial [Deltaproteobacteria bacterium]